MIYSKKQAKSEISELVNDFGKNIDLFKKSGYNEAQLENDFIRPLFGFLNWNTTNRGLEPEKQVFQLQVTGQTGDDSSKRPDYLLKVPDKNSNQMKSVFFIEAKKPSYDLKTNTKYLRQVYQYAWSTLSATNNPNERVRLALLTDFEEFRFFDCLDHTPLDPKYENKFEAFNKHILKDWTYKDYIDKFDELWDLFEYNNVVEGSLDKWFLTEKQITENRITPDRKFLDDLKEWRKEVARSMYKNDKSLDDYQLTKATLLFINRIIFIKMLSDRNIETDYLTNIISNISKSKKEDVKLYELCQDIFKRLDHIYNGSIFAYDADCDEVEISNNVLKNIFESLKPENSIYTLAAMPVEIIGYVYEQFIAEQIVKKGSGIALVPKYDEKKAKGVYYTPRYIVEYIVDNTLGKKLEECKNPEDVEKIKILDPACGSGSFLIVAFQRLLEWHKKWIFDTINTAKSKNEKVPAKVTAHFKKIHKYENYFNSEDYHNISLTHKMKSKILKNCIFGVDIDQQAVLVTKFSLSIKALEDSSHDEIINDYTIFKMPILPNLDDNIKCGNSLIASDFYYDNKPSLFNEKEKREINTFDWDSKKGFPDIMKSGGFDVIIGNPPYRTLQLGKKQESQEQEILNYYQNKYTAAFEYKINLFALFIERGATLINKEGYYSLIVPNTLYNTISFKPIRKFLLDRGIFEIIMDLRYKVFEDAEIGGSGIFIFSKENKIKETTILSIQNFEEFSYNSHNNIQKVSIKDYLKDPDYNFIQSKGGNKLLQNIKMHKGIVELGSIIKIYQGIITGDNKRFLSDKQKNSKWQPILKGRDINRYMTSFNNNYVYYSPKDLWSNTNLKMFRVKEKIISRQTSDKIVATLDTKGYFSLDSTHVIHLLNNNIDIKYLLGVYNSKLLNYLYQNKVQEEGRVFAQVKTVNLKPLPIKIIDFSNKSEKQLHDKLVSLVDQMLENQKYMHESKTNSDKEMYSKICEHLDLEIDKIVYKLYDLTPEEIDIVEGR